MSDRSDENEYEYDEDGNLTKIRISRKGLFLKKWDRVEEVRFYSKPHLQFISLACNRHLGVQGKDWDSMVPGFSRASDVLKNNEDETAEMKDQLIIFGFKDSHANDIDEFLHRLNVLKLRYLKSGAKKR